MADLYLSQTCYKFVNFSLTNCPDGYRFGLATNLQLFEMRC